MALLLQSANILGGTANLKVPAGQYAGFMLRAAGTNQAAQTLTTANLGLITAQWRGLPFTNVSFADLALFNAHIGGVVETASAAGAAFRHSAFLMASYVGDGNVFDVADDDEVYVSINLSGVTGTIVVSGTIQLFGIIAEGAQAYVPRLFTQTPSIAASSTGVVNINRDNIGMIFVNTLTNVASIQVTVDRESFVNGTVADQQSESNFMDTLETEVTTNFLLNLNRSRTIDEMLRDEAQITIIAGSGGVANPVIVDVSYDMIPDVLNRSKATLATRTQARLDRKVKLGKGRAAVVRRAVYGDVTA